jgi:dCMP deaminase
VARVIARRSTCLRRAVGCVLVDARGHVLATGHNGVAAGEPHCNEAIYDDRVGTIVSSHPAYPHACPGATAPSGTALDACRAVHAEANALLQCRDVWAIDTCYVTTAPCVSCIKLLKSTGCRRVVYLDDYPQAAEAGRLWLSGTERTWIRYSKIEE